MTDTADWSGVSAGQARVVLGPVAYTPGVSPPVNLTLLGTDRSLVVLLSRTFATDRLSVIGAQSGANYSGSFAGDVPTIWGWVCPAYGAVDQQVSLQVNGVGPARTLTVIAVPDEVALGETWAPLTVALASQGGNAAQGTNGNPLYVATGPSDTVETNPYGTGNGVTGAVSVTATTSGTAQQLLPAPPAGQLTVVDLITVGTGTAGSTVFIDGASAIANPGLQIQVPGAFANVPGYPGPLVFNEAVKVFGSASVSAVVRAKAHLVTVSV